MSFMAKECKLWAHLVYTQKRDESTVISFNCN